jgi:hypothetical protein
MKRNFIAFLILALTVTSYAIGGSAEAIFWLRIFGGKRVQ